MKNLNMETSNCVVRDLIEMLKQFAPYGSVHLWEITKHPTTIKIVEDSDKNAIRIIQTK